MNFAVTDTTDTLELQKRARRRLVGATTIALVAVLVLPWVMDQAPKAPQQDVQILVPSKEAGALASKVPPSVATDAVVPGEKVPSPMDAPDEGAQPVPPVQPKPPVPPTPPVQPVPAPSADVKPNAKLVPPSQPVTNATSTNTNTNTHVKPPLPPVKVPPPKPAPVIGKPEVKLPETKIAEPKPEVKPEDKPKTEVPPKPEPVKPKVPAPKPASEAERVQAILSGGGTSAKPAPQPAASTPAATPVSKPAPKPVAKAYVAQVGAYSDPVRAAGVAADLRSKGLNAYTEHVGDVVQVRIGSYASEAEAQSAAQKSTAAGYAAVVKAR